MVGCVASRTRRAARSRRRQRCAVVSVLGRYRRAGKSAARWPRHPDGGPATVVCACRPPQHRTRKTNRIRKRLPSQQHHSAPPSFEHTRAPTTW